MTNVKKLLIALLVVPVLALASEGGYRLERAPIDTKDVLSLQSGARTFVNYCLNCHGAQFMRYNRLRDLGLSEAQIRDNLIFTADKVGDTMKVALQPKDGRQWFGVAPPDLTVIARARGADWLYAYLRTFYRDPKTANGWNNAVFPNVGMPNALWTLQGQKSLEVAAARQGEDDAAAHQYRWSVIAEGEQNEAQFDTTVRDLVNFLVYMGEPAANSRKRIGVLVLFALGVLFVLAYAMKREFWKDIH